VSIGFLPDWVGDVRDELMIGGIRRQDGRRVGCQALLLQGAPQLIAVGVVSNMLNVKEFMDYERLKRLVPMKLRNLGPLRTA
jgi:hypothetical protein